MVNNSVRQQMLVVISNKNNESSDNLQRGRERKIVPNSNLEKLMISVVKYRKKKKVPSYLIFD